MLVPLKTPFMVASATMAPSVYEHITGSLGFNLACTYEVNLGNYRKNIYQEVCIMSGNTHDFKSDFDFIVDEAKQGQFTHRMIFVDSCNVAHSLCNLLWSCMPEPMQSRIQFYHSQQGSIAKQHTIKKFWK